MGGLGVVERLAEAEGLWVGDGEREGEGEGETEGDAEEVVEALGVRDGGECVRVALGVLLRVLVRLRVATRVQLLETEAVEERVMGAEGVGVRDAEAVGEAVGRLGLGVGVGVSDVERLVLAFTEAVAVLVLDTEAVAVRVRVQETVGVGEARDGVAVGGVQVGVVLRVAVERVRLMVGVWEAEGGEGDAVPEAVAVPWTVGVGVAVGLGDTEAEPVERVGVLELVSD